MTGASVVSDSKITDVSMTIKNVITTATALRIEPVDILRLKIVAWFLFRMVAKAEQSRTTMVTVLTPPAVPTGEPPMNISISDTREELFVRFSCGTEAKPAVLVVTDWNRAT